VHRPDSILGSALKPLRKGSTGMAAGAKLACDALDRPASEAPRQLFKARPAARAISAQLCGFDLLDECNRAARRGRAAKIGRTRVGAFGAPLASLQPRGRRGGAARATRTGRGASESRKRGLPHDVVHRPLRSKKAGPLPLWEQLRSQRRSSGRPGRAKIDRCHLRFGERVRAGTYPAALAAGSVAGGLRARFATDRPGVAGGRGRVEARPPACRGLPRLRAWTRRSVVGVFPAWRKTAEHSRRPNGGPAPRRDQNLRAAPPPRKETGERLRRNRTNDGKGPRGRMEPSPACCPTTYSNGAEFWPKFSRVGVGGRAASGGGAKPTPSTTKSRPQASRRGRRLRVDLPLCQRQAMHPSLASVAAPRSPCSRCGRRRPPGRSALRWRIFRGAGRSASTISSGKAWNSIPTSPSATCFQARLHLRALRAFPRLDRRPHAGAARGRARTRPSSVSRVREDCQPGPEHSNLCISMGGGRGAPCWLKVSGAQRTASNPSLSDARAADSDFPRCGRFRIPPP